MTKDVYIFAIASLASVDFPSLVEVGGSVQVTVLEATAVLSNVRFTALAHVGGSVAVGGATSHFGTIETIVLGANSSDLTVDGTVEIGGGSNSTVDTVTINRVVSDTCATCIVFSFPCGLAYIKCVSS